MIVALIAEMTVGIIDEMTDEMIGVMAGEMTDEMIDSEEEEIVVVVVVPLAVVVEGVEEEVVVVVDEAEEAAEVEEVDLQQNALSRSLKITGKKVIGIHSCNPCLWKRCPKILKKNGYLLFVPLEKGVF